MQVSSALLLILALCTSCATRRERSEARSIEQAETHRAEVRQQADEETLLEDVVCHEEWGSEGSPTTFRRIHLSRKARAEARGTDAAQVATLAERDQHSVTSVQHTRRRAPLLWMALGLALGVGVSLTIGTLLGSRRRL